MRGVVRVCLMCALSCAAEWGNRKFTDNVHASLQSTAAAGCVSRGVSLYDRKQVTSLSCTPANCSDAMGIIGLFSLDS